MRNRNIHKPFIECIRFLKENNYYFSFHKYFLIYNDRTIRNISDVYNLNKHQIYNMLCQFDRYHNYPVFTISDKYEDEYINVKPTPSQIAYQLLKEKRDRQIVEYNKQPWYNRYNKPASYRR